MTNEEKTYLTAENPGPVLGETSHWSPVALGDLDSASKCARKAIGWSELGRVASFLDIHRAAALENDEIVLMAFNADELFAERIRKVERTEARFRRMTIVRATAYALLVGGSTQLLVGDVRSLGEFFVGLAIVLMIALLGYQAIVKSPRVEELAELSARNEIRAMMTARAAWAISETRLYMAGTDRAPGTAIIRDLKDISAVEDGQKVILADARRIASLSIDQPTFTDGMFERVDGAEAIGILRRKIAAAS